MKGKNDSLWALVTDSGYGRLLELRRKPPAMDEIATRESATRHSPSRDIASDASGRDFDAGGPISHSKQPRSDPHEEAEVAFVQGWIDSLEEARQDGRFAQLLIAADPRTLGRLRAQMNAALHRTVIVEENRDLVKLSLPELEERLRVLAGWS